MRQEEINDLFERCEGILSDHGVNVSMYGYPDLDYNTTEDRWEVTFLARGDSPRKYIIKFTDINNLTKILLTHTMEACVKER